MFLLVCFGFPKCEVIENQTVTKRIYYTVPRDFCVLITSSFFANCSCDYFDNGGAICVSHALSTFTCSDCTFYGCACDYKYGGAVYLDVQSNSITRCCGTFCRSKYGQFVDVRGQSHVFESVTVLGASSVGRFECSATVNIADGVQSVKLVNSTRNELEGYVAAGMSLMPHDLKMSMCSFEGNVGDSIVALNFRAEKVDGERVVEFVNFANNSIKTTKNRQAIVMIFIDNVTVMNAVFRGNDAGLVAYEAGNVKSLFQGCVFDCGEGAIDIETKDCTFNQATETYEMEFINTELCRFEIPVKEKADIKVIIAASVVISVAVIVAILLVTVCCIKRRRKQEGRGLGVETLGQEQLLED